ncbi:putative metallopeptidase [Serratia phage vB_SmaM-Kashira]|nr:putative metallopeptidase [Serratia phage vB_SmaM-Kashira]
MSIELLTAPKHMTQEELGEARINSEKATRLLEMASIQLQRVRPFYGTMLASMPVVEATEWLSTCATDGRNFYYSVEFIAGMSDKRREMVHKRIDSMGMSFAKRLRLKGELDVWFKEKTPREVVFVMEHEVRHVLNEHIFRGKEFNNDEFNIAADHGINTSLVIEHSKTDALGKAWFPDAEKTVFVRGEEFGWLSLCCVDFKYLNWATEDIYRDIYKRVESGEDVPDKSHDVHLNEDGSGNKPEEEEDDSGTQPPEEPEEGEGGGSSPDENDDAEEEEDDEGDLEGSGEADSGDGEGEPEEGEGEEEGEGSGVGGKGSSDQEGEEDDDGKTSLGDIQSALGVDTSKQPEISEEEMKENQAVMRRTCEVAIINAGAAAPKEAREWLEDGQQACINYMEMIRKTLMSLRKENVSYRRPHRRSWSLTRSLRSGGYIKPNQSVVLPGKDTKKIIKVFIGFDVSGSFNDGLLRHVRNEIGGLMNQFDEFEVVLFCWSTHVGKVCRYTKENAFEINDYKIETSWGTDVFCVFNYLDTLDERVDQLIIFTDCEFHSPANEKDWYHKYNQTLWVKLGGRRAPWIAPFGEVIYFDEFM